jgi:hypothetical protein
MGADTYPKGNRKAGGATRLPAEGGKMIILMKKLEEPTLKSVCRRPDLLEVATMINRDIDCQDLWFAIFDRSTDGRLDLPWRKRMFLQKYPQHAHLLEDAISILRYYIACNRRYNMQQNRQKAGLPAIW